jgi:DNA-binding XRE family transcriptional regulator
MTPAERVFDRSVLTPAGCLEWQGALTRTGYGQIGVKGKVLSVHRVAYEAVAGPIPDGLEIDHLCRNRACVKPDHLEAVTHRENLRRAVREKRPPKAACPAGHEFTPENTYVDRKGYRFCRTCKRAHNVLEKRRKRERAAAARRDGSSAGIALRSRREGFGLSRERLAQVAGVSKRSVYSVELGLTGPAAASFQVICAALDGIDAGVQKGASVDDAAYEVINKLCEQAGGEPRG